MHYQNHIDFLIHQAFVQDGRFNDKLSLLQVSIWFNFVTVERDFHEILKVLFKGFKEIFDGVIFLNITQANQEISPKYIGNILANHIIHGTKK
jgi:hypothetical protein